MKLLFDSDKDELVVNDLHIPLNLLRCMAQPEDAESVVRYSVKKNGGVDTVTEFRVELSSLRLAPIATCRECGFELHPGIGCWRAKRRARKAGISLR